LRLKIVRFNFSPFLRAVNFSPFLRAVNFNPFLRAGKLRSLRALK